MTHKKPHPTNIYHIRLKGILSSSMATWFEGISILPQENGETLLLGEFVDQAALRGFLDQIWNLNLTVLSVERSQDENPK